MIAFVEGLVCDKYQNYLIISLQGMGFRLNYDPLYAMRMPAIGETARLYTYLSVRENDLSLYAFPEYEEKQLFELLITVSGIGPKLAGTIVASISPAEFALAILNSDTKKLSQIKGIGKKSAERLVLELRDKISKSAHFPPHEELARQLAHAAPSSFALQDEAVAALQVLGYSVQEAENAVVSVLESQETEPELGELVKLSLKSMAKL